MRLEWIVEPGGRYMARICAICGEILDPRILANREISLKRVLTGRNPHPREQEEVADVDS
jgi:hypothetical protein